MSATQLFLAFFILCAAGAILCVPDPAEMAGGSTCSHWFVGGADRFSSEFHAAGVR